MQVGKWGNSLAIRLPKDVVDVLDLKEGDDIEVVVAGDRRFEVDRNRKREEIMKRLIELSKPLPEGFKFDREEANERYREDE
jgi:antitoxin MazE